MGRMRKELGLTGEHGVSVEQVTDSMTPRSPVELPAVDSDKDSEFWQPVSETWGFSLDFRVSLWPMKEKKT